jgi:hypothetical protein
MRPAFEKAWDPIWATVTHAERVKLLKRVCLAAAAEAVRDEAERFSDATWGAALDAFEAEMTIIMQSLAEPGGTWVDIALYQGFGAMSDAMGAGITDPMAVEALRLYRPGGRRTWIASKPRRGRWVLHTKRDQ